MRNNIEIYPVWGLHKGGLGALIDGQGTAWDQADLMVQLLRQAGYTANYVQGQVDLTPSQVASFFGVSTSNACGVANWLASGGIPVLIGTSDGTCNGSLSVVRISHVWVKATIGSSTYVFDPSLKPHTTKTGINLTTATGYNATTFLTNAKSGATVTTDYIQNVNRTNVRNNLNTYATNLVNYIRANKPAGDLDDVLGGKVITPSFGAANTRQTALSYKTAGSTETTYTAIPDALKAMLRVQYQGIDRTFSSDSIYGKRLSIFFNGSNQPELRLDGTLIATGTAATPGTNTTVTFTVTHNAYTGVNQSFSQSVRAGGSYIISNGWGPTGRGLVDLYRKKLVDAKAAGGADTSEAVLGSSLATLGAMWIAQTNMVNYIADRIQGTGTFYHHQVGIAGQNDGPYVDLPGNMFGGAHPGGDTTKYSTAFYNAATHMSILESAGVQETAGVSAVSTVKLIDIAASSGYRIYNATSANYASAVAPNLTGCASYTASFQNAVNSGLRLILPDRCNLTENSWSGTGYYQIGSNSIGSIISGGLFGGFATSPTPAPTVNLNTQTKTANQTPASPTVVPPGRSTRNDPIDFFNGNYLYSHDDLVVGTGDYPHALGFRRLYNSGSRLEDGSLGKGWTHNFIGKAGTITDGFQAMGEDSGLDAAATIAEVLVSLDLMSDPNKPLDKMVIATLANRWYADQLFDNAVAVQQGQNVELFVKLPDGRYNPPPGSSARLVKNADGSYAYTTSDKIALNFDTGGKLVSWIHPTGMRVNFGYSGSNLTSVSNSLGRSLTLTYSGSRISSVTDGQGRTVSYGYDANGNLTTFTDATAKITTFEYDLPGRIKRLFYPANPTTAFATNVYDSLGRVQTQTNANGKTWNYHFSGARSEEVAPDGQRDIEYFNAFGKTLATIDNIAGTTAITSGNKTLFDYDGQQRVIKQTLPEGNTITFAYDDVTCTGTEKRCTHNLKTITRIKKSSSSLANLVESFTYEANFNKVATHTDGRGKVTNYAYDTAGNLISVTLPPAVDGSTDRPQTTYAYTSFTGAVGFPAFTLRTSETSKIDASTTVTTTTSYNTANRFVPQTVVVDSGGLNLTTTFTYDAIGNLTLVNGPRTDVTDTVAYAYDNERRVTQVTDAAGKLTRTAYDANGNAIRVSSQIGTQWQTSCAAWSPTNKKTQDIGPWVTADSNTCPAAVAPVPVTSYAYDNQDRLSTVTKHLTAAEGGNRVAQTLYFPDGSVQQIKRAVGTSLAQNYATYTYSKNGLVLTIADAKNQLTTNVYDGHDRLQAVRYPSKTTAGSSASCNVTSYTSGNDCDVYGYDANSNLTSHRTRDGQTIAMTYDNLNRLTSRTTPVAEDGLTFAYDHLGRRTAATYASGANITFSASWAYDKAGRATSTTTNGRTLSYQYDPAGNRTRLTWPDTGFYVTYAYDALNRLTSIRENGTVNLATYAYDDLSRRTTVTLGNGTSVTHGYNGDSSLASLVHDLVGTTGDVTRTYAYNQAQQITTLTTSNTIYDWNGHYNVTRPYTVNGQNQYTASGTKTLTYDGRGNLLGDGTWSFTYDIDNRMKTGGNGTVSLSYGYDAAGRLARRTKGTASETYLYDGVDLVGEYDGAGTLLRRTIHGPGIDEPLVIYTGTGTATKTWLYADHQGSVTATANSSGAPVATLSYGPYGEPNTLSGPAFRYTGQRLDPDSGLYYYKARWYSPYLGRFLQTDPIGQADDLNLYAYVKNDPINVIDISGNKAVVKNGQIYIFPERAGTPSVSIPNRGKATGFSQSDLFFHTYAVQTSTGMTDGDLLGSTIAGTPTPEPFNRPANPKGILNNAGYLPTMGDTNMVHSYLIPSPNPKKFTDVTVNYTVNNQHGLHEGFVMRYGEYGPNGKLTIKTYGEGNNWKQAPFLESIWNPQVQSTWRAIDQKVINNANNDQVNGNGK